MNVNGKHYQSAWFDSDQMERLTYIDQTRLPHDFCLRTITTSDEAAVAIKDMHIRGAILIGVFAAYAMVLAARESLGAKDMHQALAQAGQRLKATRPTAVNLAWAVDQMLAAMSRGANQEDVFRLGKETAQTIAQSENQACYQIGRYGLDLIRALAGKKSGPVNILTHCNAGWLACLDYGTATAPLYAAHDEGLNIHVWVDETRPWNQGARLTAWELGQHGVPHTVIADNTGGHLMQHGLVDMVIVGSDRTTRRGDVANKIGTYLKALAADDNRVPFYAALPCSTIDWTIADGLKEIPIEERGQEEVKYAQGLIDGRVDKVLITPPGSPAVNYGFDVTPARLVTGIITEKGIYQANEQDLGKLKKEMDHHG